VTGIVSRAPTATVIGAFGFQTMYPGCENAATVPEDERRLPSREPAGTPIVISVSVPARVTVAR
jgi:hypothetical protein